MSLFHKDQNNARKLRGLSGQDQNNAKLQTFNPTLHAFKLVKLTGEKFKNSCWLRMRMTKAKRLSW